MTVCVCTVVTVKLKMNKQNEKVIIHYVQKSPSVTSVIMQKGEELDIALYDHKFLSHINNKINQFLYM